eukprot:gene5720-5661_t
MSEADTLSFEGADDADTRDCHDSLDLGGSGRAGEAGFPQDEDAMRTPQRAGPGEFHAADASDEYSHNERLNLALKHMCPELARDMNLGF